MRSGYGAVLVSGLRREAEAIVQEKRHYVYTLAYPDGRVFYVGKGVSKRIIAHESEVRRGDVVNPYKANVIKSIWAKGGEVVKEKLAYFDTHEEALQYEVALIFFMDGLTNLTGGGEGVSGLKICGRTLSAEHRCKISASMTGKAKSEEHRRNMLGRQFSEETRRKMSNPRSEEERLRISQGLKGRTLSEEHLRHMGEARKGKARDEECRRKIANTLKGRPKSEETKRKLSASARRRAGLPPGEEKECNMLEERKRSRSAAHHEKDADRGEIPSESELYTVEQVGRILKFAPGTVRRMIDEGELKAIKVRGQWRIKREDLQDYIDRR